MSSDLPNFSAGGLAFSASFSAENFDELIKSQGIPMVIHRAMACPVGKIDCDDITRRPHEHHEGDCRNGFLLTRAGTATVGFLSNSKDSHFKDFGRIDGSSAEIVVPRFFDEKPDERIELAVFDRLYLADELITVVTWELYSAHATGIDRLKFPVVKVIDLVDANGIRYTQGVDFTIQKGQIRWTGSRQPGVDSKSGKGIVCSVRYNYRPYYYVKAMHHDLRLSQIEDEYTGDRHIERMPISASVQREYVYENQQNDSQAPDPERRQQPGPPSGQFGSR